MAPIISISGCRWASRHMQNRSRMPGHVSHQAGGRNPGRAVLLGTRRGICADREVPEALNCYLTIKVELNETIQ